MSKTTPAIVTSEAMVKLHRQNEDLRTIIKSLSFGIKLYLAGDYKCPGFYRPDDCPHGRHYYQDCEQCIDDYFEKLLKQVDQQS